MKNDNTNYPSRSEKLKKQRGIAGKIVSWIVGILVVLVVLMGVMGYKYIHSSLQPLNANSTKKVEVKIPIGSSNKQIGDILEKNNIIKSGIVFDYYVKTNKVGNFKAGYYQLSPSMTLDEIAKKLQQGGQSNPHSNGTILIKEGASIDQVADVVQKNTKFKKQDFLKLMNDANFLNELKNKYPQLLSSAVDAKDTKYKLEGYLYPATYTVGKHDNLKAVVEQMVAKTNMEMKPYFDKISKSKYSIQQVLTLASLVEKEYGSADDRGKIAGVFENRLEQDMPLQSDVAIHYALNNSKSTVSYDDLEVDSPYNLYKNKGLGPGPFNNPSIDSVKAVLNPVDKDKGYLYFVANIKTKKVYFSKTYAEHQKNVKKLQKANGYEN